MTKTVNTESIIKSVYTKQEIRFAKAQGWKLLPTRKFSKGDTLDVDIPSHGGPERKAGFVITWWTTIETTDWPASKKDECRKAIEKRAKAVRKQMAEYFAKPYHPDNIDEWAKAEDESKRRAVKAQRERDAIDRMLKEDGMYGIDNTLMQIRKGENVGTTTARYGDKNGIDVHEDFDRYSGRCKYWKITRSFTLNIRKGWHVVLVGGLLTFVKDVNYSRKGVVCEWIEQEREISKIRTVSGFLVRGEHIEAKTLKEAQAISAEHRAMQMARLLNQRKKNERRAEQKANGTLRITFQDSLNAGNCRPGTSEFKHKYEEVIGHRANDISIADLRKYGKLFGVEYYAEKAIEYALNH